MTGTRRRRRWIVVSTVAALIILTIAANAILSNWLSNKLSPKLAEANVNYDKLRVNLFKRSVTMGGVRWNTSAADASAATLATLDARGISLYSLLVDKRIEVRQLLIEDGTLAIIPDTTNTPPVADSAVNLPFRSLQIHRIVVNSVRVQAGNDTVPAYRAVVNAVVTGLRNDSLQYWKQPARYITQNISFSIADFVMMMKESPYRLRVDRIDFDRAAGNMSIDSLFLEPTKGKYEFARSLRQQVTRTDVSIPAIRLSGISIARQLEDTTVTVREVIIDQPRLIAFRDKRLPFIRDYNIPLPMAQFAELPWAVEVDTIRIRNGYISYEEFPEDGFKPGSLFFSDLSAVFGGFMNRDYSPEKYATINAEAKLMGRGKLKANFLFPLKTDLPYQASATLGSMPLTDMNQMLEHVTFMRVQSGKLNGLRLMFNYTDRTSKGNLELTYEDLKLQSLNKEKDHSVNTVKSVLINTALKNSVQQTGTIDIERERRKYVFNVWAKSAVDGLKSAVMPKPVQRANAKKNEGK